ncbi:Protein of unknown function [Gryllus bimaculatus]|nr:Protein of unknown function [Gryllus bimaculatus]
MIGSYGEWIEPEVCSGDLYQLALSKTDTLGTKARRSPQRRSRSVSSDDRERIRVDFGSPKPECEVVAGARHARGWLVAAFVGVAEGQAVPALRYELTRPRLFERNCVKAQRPQCLKSSNVFVIDFDEIKA